MKKQNGCPDVSCSWCIFSKTTWCMVTADSSVTPVVGGWLVHGFSRFLALKWSEAAQGRGRRPTTSSTLKRGTTPVKPSVKEGPTPPHPQKKTIQTRKPRRTRIYGPHPMDFFLMVFAPAPRIRPPSQHQPLISSLWRWCQPSCSAPTLEGSTAVTAITGNTPGPRRNGYIWKKGGEVPSKDCQWRRYINIHQHSYYVLSLSSKDP